jgi:hypothetical protein
MIYHPLQLIVCGWLARRFAAHALRRQQAGAEEAAPANAVNLA